ncbi:uncharacterized protein [Eurosta solidaginis]|uniref:uncharacterized protein n=1 Tax=Eurosta solidaginis TaxID=178769 RepID=UPI00353158C2
MCSRKCFRVHTLVILGVILTIVLVCIVGITLTNSINISNIIKLREKVASDSAAATGANAVQTRAALVEQQYSTLQHNHLSRSDLNYIAATHPKNLQRFGGGGGVGGGNNAGDNAASQNKIIIEIGIRNFTSSITNASSVEAAAQQSSSTSYSSSSSTVDAFIDKLIEPITGAIVDGNIDSISVPATITRRQLNASLSQLVNATAEKTKTLVTSKSSSVHSDGRDTTTIEETTTLKSSTDTSVTVSDNNTTFAAANVGLNTTPTTIVSAWQTADRMAILDHNPGQIDFEKRDHIKQVRWLIEQTN